MGTIIIIIIAGILGVAGILIWANISIARSEKKSKKLIEDFLVLISTRFSEIDFPALDPRKKEDVASDVRSILYSRTAADFNILLLNIQTMPHKIDFRYIDIPNPRNQFVVIATNSFTAKVTPLIKEVCSWILKYGKKDRPEELRAFIKSYGDHFYHEIQKFMLTDFQILQAKQRKLIHN